MLNVKFYNVNTVEESKLKYAVIMSKFNKRWIFARHRERETWEIPGGRKEKNENINTTASRELIEETGAKEFVITPVCIYSVDNGESESFGQLFYAEIKHLGELANSEIDEIQLFDDIPENLTYPLIQPYLFERVEGYCTSNKIS
ncbi:NUDIX hydrolase [Alkaliphilus peptidifermentans]|uniref:8-oxo-dGTP diphosphatase n=1 Tax=Alkaliphilus peptidifermentans DSM 18978 TaxID=1120976 RepID=A0A1G5GRU5_9FIRM|nr:NUDIX domain-containing protein [Alkaliphilus peptidifermentans]SCY54263.1 8-oxo-dGTP diphosphatase [Alkaliphilus peptidifermentans DSM 18978]